MPGTGVHDRRNTQQVSIVLQRSKKSRTGYFATSAVLLAMVLCLVMKGALARWALRVVVRTWRYLLLPVPKDASHYSA